MFIHALYMDVVKPGSKLSVSQHEKLQLQRALQVTTASAPKQVGLPKKHHCRQHVVVCSQSHCPYQNVAVSSVLISQKLLITWCSNRHLEIGRDSHKLIDAKVEASGLNVVKEPFDFGEAKILNFSFLGVGVAYSFSSHQPDNRIKFI